MERKVIQGKEYVFEETSIGQKRLMLAGIISSHDNNLVEFKSHRPDELVHGNGQLIVWKSVSDYFNELEIMRGYMDREGLNDENFQKSFLLLCQTHINNYSRLIDEDLYAYIDIALIVLNSIMSTDQQNIDSDSAKNYWESLAALSTRTFKDYIYITSYDRSNPLQPKPILSKLT